MATSPYITWIVPTNFRKKVKRLLGRPVWHPYHSLASVWIRGYQLAPHLKTAGYTVRINRTRPTPDIAVFLRRYDESDVKLARKLSARGTKIVVDVVANYFEQRERATGYPEGSNVGAAPAERVKNFMDLIDIADEVWCVSPYLRDYAEEYHDNAVFIAESFDPNHFDADQFGDEGAVDEPLIFGWSGYSTKATHLKKLRPLFERHDIELLVISNEDPDLGFDHEFREWAYKTFPRNISDTDLCVAPREITDEYTKGHSFFKIGVFMVMGVPVLASPVPSYELLIGDGEGGALCRTIEDWDEQISRFANEAEHRRQWQSEATEAVEPYLTPNVAAEIDHRLSNLLDERE